MKTKLAELFAKEKIIEVLSHPEVHPQEAAVILGIIIIIIFILLLLIGILAVKPHPKDLQKEKRDKEIKKKYKKERFLIGIEIFIAIILLITTPALIYTSTPTFCNSCHTMQKDYKTWKTSVHKNVGCVACHQEPGILGFGIEKIAVTRMAVKFVLGSYKNPILGEVRNKSCNRCHKNVKDKAIINRTIKVSHKEFLRKGAKCTECHNTVAHGKTVSQPKYPHMDYCVTCHNDKEVTCNCNLCHVEDIGKRPREIMNYPKVHMEKSIRCDGCHDTKTCNECHGVEMPHPAGFASPWQHAKLAAFDKQKICLKCHDLDFCNQCHMFPGHQYEFKPTHGKEGRTEEGCTGCHRTEKFCSLCH